MKMFLLTLLLLIASQSFGKNKVSFCHAALAETKNLSFTEIFFVYLRDLHSADAVTNGTLTILKTNLEKQSPLSNPVIKNTSDYEVHAGMVNDYLASSHLDQKLLLTKLTEFLKSQNAIKESKDQSLERTADGYMPMKFHKIGPGSFTQIVHRLNGEIGINRLVRVNHSFLMMNTKVSSYMFDRAPYDDSIITNITHLEIALFANKLSEKEGLKPAYTIRTVNHMGQTKTYAFIKDAEQTEGYRLPTWQEMGLVRTNGGQVTTDKLLPIVTEENFEQYASTTNGNVAELKPVFTQGEFFYDFYSQQEQMENAFPIDQTFADKRQYATYGISTSKKLVVFPFNNTMVRDTVLGFRLVRSVSK